MVKKSFRITNEQGIHARPATTLVKVAMEFESSISLSALKKTVDFKSIMGVMSLGMSTDKVYTIEAEGSDADDAIEALAALLTA